MGNLNEIIMSQSNMLGATTIERVCDEKYIAE